MRRFATRAALAGLLLSLPAAVSRGDQTIEYNRDVRPILAENCFSCHGPDSASRKAELRLDKREVAVEKGAITPGKPDESEALLRILSTDHDEQMPPPKSKKTLTDAQKDVLKRWVAAGAEYQPHWSLIAPQRPTLPPVKNPGWVRNPVDQFLLAKLEENRLSPAPEADRRTLARRLSLDLTGLPPEPSDVESFVSDNSPGAYDKLVDKLMNSAEWGEHRARYWLDYARYADTHGIHFDNFREMWSYREWVINAFNRNQPFDQFTIEQLAGDLLPNRTVEQQVASGFNRCNITSNEGGLIPEEYLVLYTRDRTETTAQVFMGLTAGCAVCHDHKFDPISQKEFYSLAAFFNNTTQAAMDGNISNTPPVMPLPQPRDRERWNAIEGELTQVRQAVEARKQVARADFDKALAAAAPESFAATVPRDGLTLHAPFDEGTGNKVHLTVDGKPREITLATAAWEPGQVAAGALKTQANGTLEITEAGDFEKDQKFSYGAWVKLPTAVPFGAICSRMDEANDFRGWDLWIEGGKIATHILNKWPTDAIKAVSKNPVKPNEWHHVFVSYDGSGKGEGVTIYVDGQVQEKDYQANNLKSTIKSKVPLKLAQRSNGSRVDDLLIQDWRVYSRALSAVEVRQIAGATRAAWLAKKPAAQRSEAEKNELFAWWLGAQDKPYADLTAKAATLEQEQGTLKARATVAHVMQEKSEAAMAFILFRGDYDKRRDPVKPSTPAALPPMPDDLPRNRLGLARWLLRPEHPLTARVTVNRFWQEIFGTGLVRTSGDFGVTGEQPSHPELLDWLAVEFRESGWNVKQFVKMLVTSAAYRQSAQTTPEKLNKDAANRLLSRGPRFRMDAEMVRDYALAAAGILSEKVGGPSVRPYQPEGVWEAVAMIGSNTRDYRHDSGEDLYRRSLYTFWKRAAPPASMDIFNAPSREVCTVRRERTNTPLQALVTLNDPQFVEAARHLAEKALQGGGTTPDARADFIARRLTARPLRAEENPVVQASLKDLLAFYQAHPGDAKALIGVGDSKPDPALDPATLAAYTMLTNELMNLDEVLNK